MSIKNTDYILEEISNEKNKLLNNNNYYHFTRENILNEDMCDFIINESEKYANNNKTNENPTGWTTNRHNKYPTTDLPIKDIPSINNFIKNFVIINLFNLIEENYKLNKYYLSFNDVFIVRYEHDKQNFLEKHKDGCLISFNILLNNPNDFEGGGTKFYYDKSEVHVDNTKGGLIIHSGRVNHEGIPITKGKRYILVGFIGYLKDFNNDKLSIKNSLGNHEIKTKFRNQQKFNSWKIDLNNEIYLKKIIDSCNFNNMFILDIDKKEYTYVEKLIIELVEFQGNRLNKNFLSNNYYIEFWHKNQPNNRSEHNFHIDKDELYLKKFGQLFIPILSTVTYLSTSSNPTLITNIPDKDKNFNNINKQNLIISFPKKLKHISFNGNYLHGVKKIRNFDNELIDNNRIALMFNIWSKKPYLRDLYNNDNEKTSDKLIKNLEEDLEYQFINTDQNIIKSINKDLI